MQLVSVLTLLCWVTGSRGHSDSLTSGHLTASGDKSPRLLPADSFLPDPSAASASSRHSDDDGDGDGDGSGEDHSAPGPVPPQLLEMPRGGYVTRTQSLSLSCRAVHVLHLYFRCNGRVAPEQREHSTADLVDPQTGVRQLEKQLLVEWSDVQPAEAGAAGGGGGGVGGENVYKCVCVAWSNFGENVSRPAEVRLAYLDSAFRAPPFSESVEAGHTAELRCEPPDGSPPPVVTWLKNGVPVSQRVSPNYMVTREAGLLVVAAALPDMANYSCVAENTAGRRVSRPALLTVHVSGGWSDWGPWSGCSPRCGVGVSSRRRLCDRPTPVNGGLDCIGAGSQQRHCSTLCQPVDGGWSEFGAWTGCDSSCRQYRARSCSQPPPQHGGAPCPGADTVARNCSFTDCSAVGSVAVGGRVGGSGIGGGGGSGGGGGGVATAESRVALYSGLAAALLVVAVLTLALARFYRRKSRRHSVCGLRDTGYQARFYNCKKQLSYAPDLTSDVTVLTSPPSRSSDANYTSQLVKMKRGMCMSPSEHHYDEPHLSLMNHVDVSSPCHSAGCVSPPPPALADTEGYRSAVASPTSLSLQNSSSAAFSSLSGSGSLERGESNSEQYHALLPSTLPSSGDPDVIDIKQMGCEGGVLALPAFGVSLTIPEGALPPGVTEHFYLTVATDSKDRPPVAAHETLLSPVVCAGPAGTCLLKPALLQLHHCAQLATPWTVTVLCATDEAADRDSHWQRAATVGEDGGDASIYTHMDSARAFILTDSLFKFSLLGQAALNDELCLRNMRLAAFGPRLVAGCAQYSLRVYAVEDTRAALESVVRLERKLGGRLLDKPKPWSLQSDGAPLCLCLEDLSHGWKCRPKSHYQEIPFVHVWSGGSPLLHCAFTLQSSRATATANHTPPASASATATASASSSGSGDSSGGGRQSFSARVQVYQRGCQQRRQMLRISCAESGSGSQTSDSSIASPRLMTSSLTASGDVTTTTLPSAGEVLFRLSSEVKRAVCSLLDPVSSLGNDWRMLAQLMHVQRATSYFSARVSPCEQLLDLWLARHSTAPRAPAGGTVAGAAGAGCQWQCERSAVAQLLVMLRSMERQDAGSLLEHALSSRL